MLLYRTEEEIRSVRDAMDEELTVLLNSGLFLLPIFTYLRTVLSIFIKFTDRFVLFITYNEIFT